MKKSELTSPPWNQTLFQLLLSLNKDNEHKLAEKKPYGRLTWCLILLLPATINW